ncbi:MAG: hypothetical protein V1798_03405 [Pseudomonadota bacterium]
MPRRLVILFLGALLLGCGHNEVGENYGDLTATPSQFILTLEKHPDGWQRTECFDCHPPTNIHRVNRTPLSGIDLNAIAQIVQEDGEASCASCHGTNGL